MNYCIQLQLATNELSSLSADDDPQEGQFETAVRNTTGKHQMEDTGIGVATVTVIINDLRCRYHIIAGMPQQL